ncbi:GNAT family N-acetyltransferase [Leifsonia sp. NPDC058230]|uniref:GNAT family N-acetyltransferase n=1 Tax=Leifsonia sp. NPDC058230 TaxID=3346391 RepID=UPI0036DF5019
MTGAAVHFPVATTSDRLLLRAVDEHDLDAVWRLHSDPAANRFIPAGPMTERAQAQERLAAWTDHWAVRGFGYWAVEELTNPGVVIGFGGVRSSRWLDRETVNLYYRLAPAGWGRGLATEIAVAGTEAWRATLADRPLIAHTMPDNVASQRTATAAGLARRPDLDAHDPNDPPGTGLHLVFALGW